MENKKQSPDENLIKGFTGKWEWKEWMSPEKRYKNWTKEQWDYWQMGEESRDLDKGIAMLDKLIAEKEAREKESKK